MGHPATSALLVVPVTLTGIAMLWLGATALPGAYAVRLPATIGTDALPDGATLTIVEGALAVFGSVDARAIVGGGRVWHRLAGVAVIATLAGALSPLASSASGAVRIGLVAAVGFLA